MSYACAACGKPIETSLENCPHCGVRNSKFVDKNPPKPIIGCLLSTVFGVVLIWAIVTSLESKVSETPPVKPNNISTSSEKPKPPGIPPQAPLSPLEKLELAQPSDLAPTGELAEILSYGSDFTQLQRDLKFKAIRGKVIEWRLPVYEVKQSDDGYLIQTGRSFRDDPLGNSLVGTFLHVTPRSDDDRQLVERLKTGDVIKVKGVIDDVTIRNLDIKPALLVTEKAKAINGNFESTTIADLQIILAARSVHCTGTGSCEIDRFSLKPTDVNGDGKPEFIVTHTSYCGSGGCMTLLMAEESDHTWTRLASTFGPIRIEKSSTRGYKDISFINQTFSWSGRAYIANGKLSVLK